MFREDVDKILLLVVFILTTAYVAVQDLNIFFMRF
jgi:hypothetical protein